MNRACLRAVPGFFLVTDMINGRFARWLTLPANPAPASTASPMSPPAWRFRSAPGGSGPTCSSRKRRFSCLAFRFSASLASDNKYRRLLSYHTWGNKFVFVVMAVTLPVIFAGGPGWLLRILMPLAIASQIEEIAITAVLLRWRADVPSLWHALQLKNPAVAVPPIG